MSEKNASIVILMADDDEDDRLMTRDAFGELPLASEFRTVNDGVELLEYLTRTGTHSDPALSPRPGLILLDLNMPRMDGREALKVIKQNPALRTIPVVVLTTSKAQEDIILTYNQGVNSFIVKPTSFDQLVETVRTIIRYWFEIVELPETATRRV